ncbi:hypothetical protein V1509DRAFT_106376 [Lipomyces kononenkoae]
MPWLPLIIDSQELVPRDFGPDNWEGQLHRSWNEFVAYFVVGLITVEGIPGNTALAFEHIALGSPGGLLPTSYGRKVSGLKPEEIGLSRHMAPPSPVGAREVGFSRGDLGRLSFKFIDEFADCGDLPSAVRASSNPRPFHCFSGAGGVGS